MTANPETWKLAATTVLLLMCAAPLFPAAGAACTPGSLLCPTDGARQGADRAVTTVEGDAADAVDSVQGQIIPDAQDRISGAFDQANDARGAADDAFSGALPLAQGALSDTRDLAFSTVDGTIMSLPRTVNGLGDGVDHSLTDVRTNDIDPKVQGARDLADHIHQDVQPILDDPYAFAVDTAGPILDDVGRTNQQLDDTYVQPTLALAVQIIGWVDVDPVLEGYGMLRDAVKDMVNHNYGSLYGQFGMLPDPSVLAGAEQAAGM